MKQSPTMQAAWKELAAAPTGSQAEPFIRLCQVALAEVKAGKTSIEQASYIITGAVMFDALDDTPEFEHIISIASQLEIPSQPNSSRLAEDEKDWRTIEKLVTNYAAGRREGVTQRVRLTASKMDSAGRTVATMGGWVFVKYGRLFILLGSTKTKAEIGKRLAKISLNLNNEKYLEMVQTHLDGLEIDGYVLNAEVVNHMKGDGHSESHSKLAFCGSAGPEEMRHLGDLLAVLSDDELIELTGRVGIRFTDGPNGLTREDYEGVIDEAARDDFYREYRKLLSERKK